MRWSFPITRILGIELRVHVTFLLLLAWFAGNDLATEGWKAAAQGLAVVLMIFTCVVLHELGHATAARRFGIRTADITLLPMGGVAHLERIPERPREEIIVALAGPFVSAILAVLFWVLSGFSTPNLEAESTGFSGIVSQLFSINLGLLLFNLLPAFPMDGGRVFRALLTLRMGRTRGTQIAARVGQILAVVLGVVGWLYSINALIFVAAFVYFGAANEAAHSQLRAVSRKLRISDAMITHFRSLSVDANLGDAADLLQHSEQHDFPLVDQFGQLKGLLTRKNLILGLHEFGASESALKHARTDLPSLLPSQFFTRAFEVMQEHNTPTLPVVNAQGQLVGLFSQEKVGELLLLQTVHGKKYA